jgi:glycosyltransferase involved in cell wall biosynthesis
MLICPPEARIHAEAPNWGVPVVGLPIGRKRPLGVKVLYAWLKRNPCDLVATHSATDAWLAALALLAMGRPVPTVRTCHSSAPVPRNAPNRWLYTSATARIVTTGEALKTDLVERNGFPAQRIDSVPTGIDAARFRPGDRGASRALLNLPRDRQLVGIVAGLRVGKGHRFLIEALPEQAHLVVVGDGPMRAILEDLVVKKNLNEKVVFVGAIREAAIHEKTALVVPAQDSRALGDAIQRLLSEPALARRLGDEARRYCAANFSYQRMLDRMEEIYRQVSR